MAKRVELGNSYPNDELLVNGSAVASGSVTGTVTVFAFTNTVIDCNPVVVITGSGSLTGSPIDGFAF